MTQNGSPHKTPCWRSTPSYCTAEKSRNDESWTIDVRWHKMAALRSSRPVFKTSLSIDDLGLTEELLRLKRQRRKARQFALKQARAWLSGGVHSSVFRHPMPQWYDINWVKTSRTSEKKIRKKIRHQGQNMLFCRQSVWFWEFLGGCPGISASMPRH